MYLLIDLYYFFFLVILQYLLHICVSLLFILWRLNIIQSINYLAMLKFYSKLINDNLHNYFDDFMPDFSIGVTIGVTINIRNPDLQLPKLRYKLPHQILWKLQKIARNIILLITSEKVLRMNTGTRM